MDNSCEITYLLIYISGSKWITNKWIRWYHQALTFPCDTEKISNARLRPLANDISAFLPHGRANLQPLHILTARKLMTYNK